MNWVRECCVFTPHLVDLLYMSLFAGLVVEWKRVAYRSRCLGELDQCKVGYHQKEHLDVRRRDLLYIVAMICSLHLIALRDVH